MYFKFFDLNQQLYVQSENLKYQLEFDDVYRKPEFQLLPKLSSLM